MASDQTVAFSNDPAQAFATQLAPHIPLQPCRQCHQRTSRSRHFGFKWDRRSSHSSPCVFNMNEKMIFLLARAPPHLKACTSDFNVILLELEDCLKNTAKEFKDPPKWPGLESGCPASAVRWTAMQPVRFSLPSSSHVHNMCLVIYGPFRLRLSSRWPILSSQLSTLTRQFLQVPSASGPLHATSTPRLSSSTLEMDMPFLPVHEYPLNTSSPRASYKSTRWYPAANLRN